MRIVLYMECYLPVQPRLVCVLRNVAYSAEGYYALGLLVNRINEHVKNEGLHGHPRAEQASERSTRREPFKIALVGEFSSTAVPNSESSARDARQRGGRGESKVFQKPNVHDCFLQKTFLGFKRFGRISWYLHPKTYVSQYSGASRGTDD